MIEALLTAIQALAQAIEAEKGETKRLTHQALRERQSLFNQIERFRDVIARQGTSRIRALRLVSQERHEIEAQALKARIKVQAPTLMAEEEAVRSLGVESGDLERAIARDARFNEDLTLKSQEGQLIKQKAAVEAVSVGHEARIREEQTAFLKKKIGDGQLEKQYLVEQLAREDQELKRLKDSDQSLLNEQNRLVREKDAIQETSEAQRRQCAELTERVRQRGKDLARVEKECAHRIRQISTLIQDLERLGPRSDEQQRQELQGLLDAAAGPWSPPRGTLMERIRAYLSHA